MAIILEYQDFAEVADSYEMINEGFFDNIWSKIKDKFKGISGDVDKLIADEAISRLIDMKTGELEKTTLGLIQSAKGKEDVKKVYDHIRGIVKNGQYFLRSIKFQEDGMLTLMDQVAANKVGLQGAQKTTAQKPEGASAQSATAEKGTKEELVKRVADFDKTYKASVAQVTAETKKQLDQLVKKSSAESTKNLINNRFSLAQTVALLIEYDIKKLRLGLENLDSLKQEMVGAYKTSLESAKQLQSSMSAAKAEGGVTLDVYNGMNIDAFLKEYPAEQVKGGEPIDNFFVYPYEGDKSIVIAAYDINEKKVGYHEVAAGTEGGKLTISSELLNVPFDEFKEKFLEASKNVPPKKQKGGITKPEPTAAPAGQGTEKS